MARVRGLTAGLLWLTSVWFVNFIGACIVSAYVKPGDQADAMPIFLRTGGFSFIVALLCEAPSW